MATLPRPDERIYLLSSNEIHVSSMWAFRGQFQLAFESLQVAHDLKQSESPIDLQGICWVEDNLATIHGCLLDFDTAIEWSERSRATWKTWSESAGVAFKCPPLLTLTHGRLLAHAQRLDEAWARLNQAVDGFLSAEPVIWAPTATWVLSLISLLHQCAVEPPKKAGRIQNAMLTAPRCKFTIARLLMFRGSHDAAESMLAECQSMWLQGDKSRALDFNGIIVYQLGCCALMRGNLERAL